ncbi:MAG: GGDEF domain-containing protein [Acidobacteria bacterium]|nr:GGDEF domain-containing protein [Acidobacteriota bacterium]
MRLFGRHDSVLVIGLTVALTVVFARQISQLLEIARDVEQAYGLALIPGLIILTVVFVLHQQGKRQEMKAEAVASAAAAHEAEVRANDLEQLIAFGQALARSLDLESIRDVLLQHLPQLAGTSDVWVLSRLNDAWHNLLTPSTREDHREIDERRERAAEQAVSLDPNSLDQLGAPLSVDDEGQLCFPMLVGGTPVGVVGLPKTNTLTDGQRRMLAAASALLAVSVKNAQLFRETRENGLRDGLTGCVNRTHGLDVTDTELRRARRSKVPTSVIMFDLDHFKEINDRHGHPCGDAVLSTVGQRLKAVLRASDVKCRYGGEEFLVVLPETAIEGASRVAELLRKEIADAPMPWNDELITMTASFGVTTALANERETPVVIARADAALYRAKSDGRNCVRIAVDPVKV